MRAAWPLAILLSLCLGSAPVYAQGDCGDCEDGAPCLSDCGDQDCGDESEGEDACAKCPCCPTVRVVVHSLDPVVAFSVSVFSAALPEPSEPVLSAPSDGIFQPPRA